MPKANAPLLSRKVLREELIDGLLGPSLDLLTELQEPSGAMPWFAKGHTEPWCTVESAMAFLICDRETNWEKCFGYLGDKQLPDGSFFAEMGGQNHWWRRETNFAAYVATGLWHHWLVKQDIVVIKRHWSMVKKAIDFVVRQQNVEGDIRWAVNGRGGKMDDALITGCACIFKSLECAIRLANLLGEDSEAWALSRFKLGAALRFRPWRFDRTWETKRQHSMDWFYPVLCGVYTPQEGIHRLRSKWFEFVDTELGCKCVSDKSWFTVAETCELVMALLYCGEPKMALKLYAASLRHRNADGLFETGYVSSASSTKYWPKTPMSWTAAAVVLATDALYDLTGASKLFVEHAPHNYRGTH